MNLTSACTCPLVEGAIPREPCPVHRQDLLAEPTFHAHKLASATPLDLAPFRDVGRTGRTELIRYIHTLCDALERTTAERDRLQRDHATMLETLTYAQARGTELLEETRVLKATR